MNWFSFGLCIAAIAPIAGAAVSPCDSMSSASMPNTTVTSAKLVDAGAFAPPAGTRGPATAYKSLPAFCRVTATLKPSSDSDIKIEVWLPASGWNGKLQAVGNGAWAGVISYPALATAVAAGYAAASTDTGHEGNQAGFIQGHPEKLIDFAYRAVHEMTVAAKGLTTAYYHSAPKLSYWNGCSTGGRQAMAELQRYPNDYDGIIAGAPANYTTNLQAAQLWTWDVDHKNGEAVIPQEKFSLLHNAVLEACDSLDGVKDGVLEDPTRCHFDPKVLACKNGDGPNCLTAAQVETAQKIYAGPAKVFPGLERGSESGWNMLLAGSAPMSYAVEIYKDVLLRDPNFDAAHVDPDSAVAHVEKDARTMMNSIDPNLKPFFSHNGKLLQYHGWADPGIPPQSSVNYYKSVADKMGGVSKIHDSYRLFMVPGMGHCGGGDGTSTFDMVAALNQWVESGKAPEQIVASRVRNGAVDRTRPLCPYPQVATYKGSGSTDDAANFACRVP